MGGVASRSRVSMDALPADDTDRDHDSHHTITPSSSTASLPHSNLPDQPPAPPLSPFSGASAKPTKSTSILGPQPVGLGLPTYLGGTGRSDWPVVRDVADELDSDLEDDVEADVEQREMETYQSTYREPVDATLRSMPGIIALGDGWASGSPQHGTSKRRWFRRTKNEEPAVTEDDPLTLWAACPTSTAAPANHESMVTPSSASDPNAKWWRSRRNLFASQKNLASPSMTTEGSETRSSPAKNRSGWVNRSRLNFGSMVDLGRSNDKRKATAATESAQATPTPSTSAFPLKSISSSLESTPTPKAKAFARHSVGGIMRKGPPHPLELSDANSAAARSQPAILSASSSQPSFFPSPSLEHPLLRMSYARSESHLAGGGGSPGIPPPRPVVADKAAWRPPRLSPTALLEVEEEEEPEEPSSLPTLKRTATFGDDDDELAKHQQTHNHSRPAPTVSQAPGLQTVQGSPQEPQRTLSSTASTADSNVRPPSSLLGRIKNALTRGRGRNVGAGRKAASISSSHVPASPRSVVSEQPLPTTPTRASLLPPPRSVGPHGAAERRGVATRRRSRLWSRAGRDAPVDLSQSSPETDKSRRPSLPTSVDKRSYRMSKHVVESMINLSPSSNADTFGSATGTSIASSTASPNPANRRTSWAAPIPPLTRSSEEEDYDDKAEKRNSRVSLRRFKAQKQRPGLGAVFPRPPDSVDHPPSLHWAFPGSYSTPMLHKFGGSTLSLALDISSTANNDMGLDDIQESPHSPRRQSYLDDGPVTERERAISATIMTLTGGRDTGAPKDVEPPVKLQSAHRNSIPVNIENLTNSSDSLTLPAVNMVNFPLPPSSSGDLSSPDPDQVEQLRTPHDASGLDYYTHGDDASDESSGSYSGSSGSSRHLRKQPSWSTCKTSSAAGTSLTPIATPNSTTASMSREQQQDPYRTARGSISSLINDPEVNSNSNNSTAAAAYMVKAAASMAPTQRRPIVA